MMLARSFKECGDRGTSCAKIVSIRGSLNRLHVSTSQDREGGSSLDCVQIFLQGGGTEIVASDCGWGMGRARRGVFWMDTQGFTSMIMRRPERKLVANER